MDRIFDKAIVLASCTASLFFVPLTTELIVGLLSAITVGALQEAPFFGRGIRWTLLFGYAALAVFFPVFVIFLPLVAYDLFRIGLWVPRFCWIVPLGVAAATLDQGLVLFVAVVSLVACVLSWRTVRTEDERAANFALRDQLRELSLSLEQKNQDLLEKQDYEVAVATLAERARIAREIHDNVGHLLTRSVLQIEASQVVHADDPALVEELQSIGTTIHEAFDTVRESVHDLHEDSFDLRSQLSSLAEEAASFKVELDYQADGVPSTVGYAVIAIVREALANASKHSDATKVRVTMIDYPAFWQLAIHDNGSKDPFPATRQGEAAAALLRKSGIGLKTMEERARALKGVFRIDYDRGVRVFVSVPKQGETPGKDR